MRHEHILQRVKGEAQPKQIISVEAQARVVPHSALAGCEIEILDEWHAVYWIDGEIGSTPTRIECGRDTESWWRLVDLLIRRGVITWIFSIPAGRCYSLLGLWDEIEAGAVYISGRDHRNVPDTSADTVSSVQRWRIDPALRQPAHAGPCVSIVRDGVHISTPGDRAQHTKSSRSGVGYAVLEDPPSIVQCRRRGRAGIVRWLDMRNYGYSGTDAPSGAPERAQWIMDTVLSMINMLKVNDLGGLQNTAASQSLHILKRRYLSDSIMVHCHPEALALEREAYYGGRCEARKIGECGSPVYHLDFRSFYPGLCADNLLPIRLLEHHDGGSPGELSALPSDVGAIARVDVITPAPIYPLRRGDITIFPTGMFTTALTGPEVLAGLARGDIIRVHSYATYELAPALREYAMAMAALRRAAEHAGNSAGAEYLKRLAVSITGKFAQTNARWEGSTELCADHPYECWYEQMEDGGLQRWRSIGWECQREWKSRPGERPSPGEPGYQRWCAAVIDREAGESCPAISAWITSAGRMLLWSAICAAGPRHVYYYDTDSLFVDENGLMNLASAGLVGTGEIGRLTVRSIIDRFTVHGLKHYTADGVATCSGEPKGEILPGPDSESYYLRAWIGRHINNGEKPRTERVRLKYSRRQEYRHGMVKEGGWVEPLKV